MQAYRNTLLAMKLSTILMSLSATILIVLLLTSNMMAKRGATKPQPVISAEAHATKTANRVTPSRGGNTLTIRLNPVASPTSTRRDSAPRKTARHISAGNLPTMPKLAAIPDVPDLPAPAAPPSGGTQAAAPQPQVSTTTS